MNRRILLSQMIGLTTVLLILVACGTPQPTPTPSQLTTTPTIVPPTATPTPVITPTSSGPDYWPIEGWRTTTPEEQGMDSDMLAKMLELIQEQNYDIHSVTIIRNGYMVADATIYPYDPGSKHIIHSCTKSITSALIGIAIEQGYIESVKQPVLSFFPERTVANLDANKEAMTLEHLLMMASGLECRDSYLYSWRGLFEMMQTDDWVQFMLDLPMAEPPGTRFEYCNGASFLLSAIIQEKTGMSAAAFAEEHLFDPLGISDVAWPANSQGITIGWGELRMRPHDMAKIGYLYLNNGQWNGEQIIPADWVTTSTHRQIAATFTPGYGYQWWVAGDNIYMALGLAGQYIIVAPELDLVVVFTSNLEDNTIPFGLLYDFIIPTAKAPIPIAPNPDGVKLLESKIQQVALSQEVPEPVPPLPEIAQRVTGQTYILDPNPLGFLSVSLTFQEEAEALMSVTPSPDELQQAYGEYRQYWNDKKEWPIGLDNVYRFTLYYYGIPMALKGWWINEEKFVIYHDFIGNTGRLRLEFTFDGDKVEMLILDGLEAGTRISGKLEE